MSISVFPAVPSDATRNPFTARDLSEEAPWRGSDGGEDINDKVIPRFHP